MLRQLDILTVATLVAILTFIITMVDWVIYDIKNNYPSTCSVLFPVVFMAIILLPWIKDWLKWPIPDYINQVCNILIWLLILFASSSSLWSLFVSSVRKIALAIIVVQSGAWEFLTTYFASLAKCTKWVEFLNRPILVYLITGLIVFLNILYLIRYKIKEKKEK